MCTQRASISATDVLAIKRPVSLPSCFTVIPKMLSPSAFTTTVHQRWLGELQLAEGFQPDWGCRDSRICCGPGPDANSQNLRHKNRWGGQSGVTGRPNLLAC